MVDAVQELQAVFAAQGICCDAKALEAVQEIILDALQPWLRRAKILRFNAEGDELGLGEAVVALGQLTSEHIGILFTDVIKVIVLVRNQDGLLEFLDAGAQIQERELKADGTVKVVEEITPAVKNGRLVQIGRASCRERV